MFSYDGVLLTTPAEKVLLLDKPGQIPVLILGDSLSRWRALKKFLLTEPDFTFVSCPEPDNEILTHCSRFAPCVLLIEHACIEKLDTQKFIETVNFGRAVCVLVKVRHNDSKAIEQLLRMGCMGFITEKSTPPVLANAIRAVVRGEIWASRRTLSNFVRGLLASENPHNLTRRETEILLCIGDGLNNNSIAEKLFISRETVRWHIRTLYGKIGVRGRADAARYVSRLRQEPQGLQLVDPRGFGPKSSKRRFNKNLAAYSGGLAQPPSRGVA